MKTISIDTTDIFDNSEPDNDIDEDMKLTRDDYLKILHHYLRDKPPKNIKLLEDMSTSNIQKKALTILGNNFCDCIRPRRPHRGQSFRNKLNKRRIDYKTQRISTCTKSIFNNRGLKRHGFRCRNKTNKLVQCVTKTRKHIEMQY